MPSLSTSLWSNLQSGGGSEFWVTPSLELSYGDALRGVQRWLAAFDAAGLKPGDRVVIRTAQDHVAAVAFLAGLVDGVVPVLLEGSCPDARFQAIVGMTEPGLVLSDNAVPDLPVATYKRVLTARQKPRGLRFFGTRIELDGFGLEGLEPSERPARQPDDDGIAYLLFTSGTTASPSGVVISRSNLAANLATIERLFEYTSSSRIFNDMVLAHADGMIQGPILAVWSSGAVLRAGGFDVSRIEEWLACVRRFRATHVITVPTVWALIDRLAAHDDYFDSPECALLMTVAAKMPAPLWSRIEARFGRALINHYGLTETVASSLYAGSKSGLGAHGTVGIPIDCEARIAGFSAEDASGELELRGANVFSAYWRNPERTAASFTEDGWFRTGDLARKRTDGSYEVVGRVKTAIVSGGVLIHPEEIDDAMLRHPCVTESVTVGVVDEVFDEISVTCVVLSRPCDEASLTAHLRQFVEPRKVSKKIFSVNGIPKGLSGKPQLIELRNEVIRLMQNETGVLCSVDHTAAVLSIAARVFRVPLAELSIHTRATDVAGWDSFTQLNLVLHIEEHFACQISAAQVSALRSLGDFVRVVQTQA